MKTFTALMLLMLAASAQAQMYRCVDAKGKVQYSDKPIAGCQTVKRQENAAPAPKPKPAAKAAPKASRSAAAIPRDRQQQAVQ